MDCKFCKLPPVDGQCISVGCPGNPNTPAETPAPTCIEWTQTIRADLPEGATLLASATGILNAVRLADGRELRAYIGFELDEKEITGKEVEDLGFIYDYVDDPDELRIVIL